MIAGDYALQQPDDHFEELWALPGERFETGNTREGGGSSEVVKLGLEEPVAGLAPGTYFIKKQTRFHYRSRILPWRRYPLVRREELAIRRFARLDIGVPEVVYFSVTDNGDRAILITRELPGYRDLSDSLALVGDDQSSRNRILALVADGLLRMHRARYAHGALYPKHIFLHEAGSMALIDLEKVRRRLTRSLAAVADLSRLLRHGDCFTEADVQQLLQVYARELPTVLHLLQRYLQRRGEALLAAQVATARQVGGDY